MKYAFFPGCAHDTSAGYKESLDAVCSRLEIELVEITDWNCCGATITAGESRISSIYLAARSFALSEKMGFTDILTGCNACYTTLRKSADIIFLDKKETDTGGRQIDIVNKQLLSEGLELTRKINVRHVMDVLFSTTSDMVLKNSRNIFFSHINIACYYGCQYTRPWIEGRESEDPQYMENFLESLGFNAIHHSAKTACCGAAGAMPNISIAQTLVRRIMECARKASADAVVTICPLCQFNLDTLQSQQGTGGIPVLFFTQLMGLCFGIEPEKLGMEKLLVSSENVIKQFQHHKKAVES